MNDKPIVRLTKIKQWYIPADAESYLTLQRAGAALSRIHENLLPTLRLLTQTHGITFQAVSFNDEILHPYLDKLGSLWNSKKHRKATITTNVLKFETTNAEVQKIAKLHLEKVETSVRNFFTRWGYSHQVMYSESRGKVKLHVDYKYDSNRLPVLPIKEDAAVNAPEIVLKIGFVRITLKMDEREVTTNVAIAAGTGWNSLHTSKCLYSQISNVRPFIAALMDVVNKDEFNFENPST